MNYFDFLFNDTYINLDGDNALTFLAYSMVFIMLISLLITNWITTPKKESKGKAWAQVPTSSNIKPN